MSNFIYTPHTEVPALENLNETDYAKCVSVAPIRPHSSIAGRKTAFWKYYYRSSTELGCNIGLSDAIAGSPAADKNSVLSNCVGYAQGRFSEIFSEVVDCNSLFSAGLRFQGRASDATSMPCSPKYSSDVKNESIISNIAPGTIITYVNKTNSSKRHCAVVEKVLSFNGDVPTKLEISEGHYGSYCFVTKEIVEINGGLWTIGDYIADGYIFNPAIKRYNLPDEYCTLKYAIAKDCVNNKVQRIQVYGTEKPYNANGISSTIRFKTPGDVSGRILLVGNYKDSKTSCMSLEIKNKKLRFYMLNSKTGAVLDKSIEYEMQPNTDYTAKFSCKSNKVFFCLLNVDADAFECDFDFISGAFDNLCLFKDYRNDTSVFSSFVSIEWFTVFSNSSPLSVIVPVKNLSDNSVILYDLQHSKSYGAGFLFDLSREFNYRTVNENNAKIQAYSGISFEEAILSADSSGDDFVVLDPYDSVVYRCGDSKKLKKYDSLVNKLANYESEIEDFIFKINNLEANLKDSNIKIATLSASNLVLTEKISKIKELL